MDSEPQRNESRYVARAWENKTLRSGAWLRKSRFVAKRGHRGHLFKLREEQAEIQKKDMRLLRKFLDIHFYCQLTVEQLFQEINGIQL